jgi:predicted phage baseplate assembly protein
VVFGTGTTGARLPTGVENVKATYRSGIGAEGNARAEQISQLQTRPLGVKSVINPLRASGGADRETRDQARDNAPLAVMALDRLVSVADYGDFTRTFAGIGKASARRISDGREELVHVTIAGEDDIPIDPSSDLYANLLLALGRFGDPGLTVRVDARELVALVLSAKISLEPDYQWEPVVTAVRAAVLERFGFRRASLGAPVLLSSVVSTMQGVPGVRYVDVDAFGGVPERRADPETGERKLLSLDEMSEAVVAIATQSMPAQRVSVNTAGAEQGKIRPAQLAMFSPAVPDTLILNQIS